MNTYIFCRKKRIKLRVFCTTTIELFVRAQSSLYWAQHPLFNFFIQSWQKKFWPTPWRSISLVLLWIQNFLRPNLRQNFFLSLSLSCFWINFLSLSELIRAKLFYSYFFILWNCPQPSIEPLRHLLKLLHSSLCSDLTEENKYSKP